MAAREQQKEELRQRMAMLHEEIAQKQRTLMGAAVPLPSLGNVVNVEVTALHKNGHGAFVASEFGNGFLHATEASRRIIQIHRGEDSSYAVLGDESYYLHAHAVGLPHHAKVMSGKAVVESLLPVGRRMRAEVTGTEGGQIYFSMRDIDQLTAGRKPPLALAPFEGEPVTAVVAHVNEPAGAAWALCKLPDYFVDGAVVEGFLARRDQHLGGHVLERGDVLRCHVIDATTSEDSPRIRLRLGEDRRAQMKARKARKQAKAAHKQMRAQHGAKANGRLTLASSISKRGRGKKPSKKKEKARLLREMSSMEGVIMGASAGKVAAAGEPSAFEAGVDEHAFSAPVYLPLAASTANRTSRFEDDDDALSMASSNAGGTGWDEELMAQGVKPWDEDAGAVMGVLYGGE